MNEQALSLLSGKRVYLSGPMSGIKDHNRPAFREASKALRRHGVIVVSPDELDEVDPAEGTSWEEYLSRDIPWVANAEAAVVLPGWEASRGTILELCIINTLKRPAYQLSPSFTALRPIPTERLPTPAIGVRIG